jgi:hypothetical protein
MDCMDCHNRPAYSYELPERALDRALFTGIISPALPYAKKKGVELLKRTFNSRETAKAQISQAFAQFYRDNYPEIYQDRAKEVSEAGRQVLAIWERNIFRR